ncbi:cytochrome P450 [Streptomyces hydrogenans]|uniref:Cytochrome P450 n=1 Tax=Streptomyces hydrogenans TaxID=1873719 RepID=A0ABQ3PSA1_9ACTN|nr:cytochrome P450 [Streptomyces hydrogenans]GHG22202.1 cytochrome P450 [Streptomyces hydrogenans]GHI27915.1 cytochrome P450 [Streptomyces hydrogenans]
MTTDTSAAAALAAAAPGPDVDLFSQEFAADPFPVFDRLRRSAPVHHDPVTRLWLVSRDEDVRRVLLDPTTYRNDNALGSVLPLRLPALRILDRAGFKTLPPALFNNSTESHPVLRGPVLRLFGAQRVRAALPMIERVTHEELDLMEAELDATGRHDFARGPARTIPVRVMLELLGVPEAARADIATVADWTDAFIGLFWGRTDKDRQRELAVQVADFYTWLCELAARPDAPEDSLLGALAKVRMPDGSPVPPDVAVAVCSNLMVAGHVTTSQMISTAVHRALETEGQWRALGRDPGLAEGWTEETLRREPSLTAWRRITSRPVTLGGVDLPEGAELLLLFTSAGTDPEAHEEPLRICPMRAEGRAHLGFGLGRHRCPGAELARAEGRVVLGAAAARFPGLRLASADRPPFLELVSFRAPTRLDVTHTPTRTA